MSKAVLISIRPKWCELIASGEKSIEVRKTRPKIETPFKCYMYMSAYHWAFSLLRQYGMDDLADRLMHETGKVIGEFVCDRMDTLSGRGVATEEYLRDVCLTVDHYNAYRKGCATYFWHISNLVIYDEPKQLSEFRADKNCHRGNDREDCAGCWDCEISRPPESWRYVEELE